MKRLEDLRETLCKELDEIAAKREIDKPLLENIRLLTDSIKNIDKIMMLENGEIGYSQAGGWEARGMYGGGNSYNGGYGGGNSYANRGKHYVRGHYSRDNSYNDGYGRRGNYSRDGGNYISEHLREMMEDADGKEREAIKRCLKELEE